MSKSVVDGKLLQVSPSSINAFDATTPFGCERRWFFRYVLDKPEPQTGNLMLGTNLHAMNEEYLANNKLLLSTQQCTDLFNQGKHYLDEIRPRVKAVEQQVKASLAGVPLLGYCDVVLEDGIVDWKTSKDVKRYGKKPFELKRDTQMLVYARELLPGRETWKLVHGQYQTEGKTLFSLSETVIRKYELDAHFENVIIPLVERMKKAAGEKEVSALQADREKCFRCPHKLYCPKEEDPIMSFLSKFKKQNEVVVVEPAPVLPPDAPASQPALAAKPVEGFTPVPAPRKMNIVDVPVEAPASPPPPAPVATPADAPAAKRGPGRPPGAKNKPKEEAREVADRQVAAAVRGFVAEVNGAPLTVKTVTLTHGLTLNLGNYNSARVDVAMSAEVAGDLSAAFAQLSDLVREKLSEEMEGYRALATKDAK